MKVEDLMIEDFVYYSYPNPFVTKVIDVCSHGEEHFIRCKRDEKDNLYKQDQLEDFNVGILRPIPLTPEILKKNGFNDTSFEANYKYKYVIHTNKYQLGYYLKTNSFNIYKKGIDPFYTKDVFCCGFQNIVKYVHELQHALKLCGINKEIVV